MRVVGPDHALDIILSGKNIPGPEALRIAPVNDVWLLEELLQAERRAVKATVGTADSQEGMMAFLEKQNPVFNK